jgi:hypothetical protein
MDTNPFPENLYDYYRNNPSLFEERVDGKKRTVNYALLAVCALLLVFPSIIPAGNLLVRIVAAIGALYFGYGAFFGSRHYYSLASGGKINDLAIKKFASPASLDDCRKIIEMLENDDFAGLASEPDADDRPLQLYLHEDAGGKTFYLQLMWHFSASDFRGITGVKVVKEPQYSHYYSTVKRIKST